MLSPIDSKQNYFNLFRLEPKYNIDKNQLLKSYQALSKKYHPDIIKNESAFQKINEAYQTLKNDYKRAVYLKSKIKNDVKLNPEFLENILNLEEDIANANEKYMNELEKKINTKIDECKFNYKNDEYLKKWRYFERLRDAIKKKREFLSQNN